MDFSPEIIHPYQVRKRPKGPFSRPLLYEKITNEGKEKEWCRSFGYKGSFLCKKKAMESVVDSRAPVWSFVRNHIWEPVASAAASSTPPSSQSPEAPKKIDGKRKRSKGGIKDSSSSNTSNNNNVANGNDKRKSETSFHTIPEPQPRQVWFPFSAVVVSMIKGDGENWGLKMFDQILIKTFDAK